MSKPVRVLVVDDSEDDARMAVRSLERGGFEVQFERVDTAHAVEEAWSRQSWDAVIADYRMPQFTGLDALKIVRASGSDIPFVLVSGSVGEEIAVEAMRAGANDFVIKTNLSRLASILDRELRESASRSERKRAEQELQRFRMAMDVLPDSMYLTDPAAMRFVYLNNTACRRLGYSRDRLLQMDVNDVLPVGRELLRRGYDEVIAAGDRGLVQESPFAQSDGTKGWAEIHSRALRIGDGTLIVTIGRNITERKQADERIRRLNRIYAVLSGINSTILRVGNRTELFQETCRIAVELGGFGIAQILMVDEEAYEIWPGPSAGADALPVMRSSFRPGAETISLRGTTIRALRERKPAFTNDITAEPAVGALRAQALQLGYGSVISLPLVVGARIVAVLLLCAKEKNFFDQQELRLLSELAGDIEFALDTIEKRDKLDYLAYYDQLTGLANRALFHERLSQFLGTAALEKRKLAVQVFDIERFRAVNETLGRQAGDDLLRQIAERARRFVTDPNWLARIGPDQFASTTPEVASSDAAVRRAEQRVREILGEPFKLGEAEVRVSAKLGIAMFPDDGADADALLRNAEAALQQGESVRRPLPVLRAGDDRRASRRTSRWRTSCARRWRRRSSSCITSRRWIWRIGASSASRR